MNILNLDQLSFLKNELDKKTIQYIAGAMGVNNSNLAFRYIARRFGYDVLQAVFGQTEHVTFYPVKLPELNGLQNIQSFFIGDCELSFYILDLPGDAAPWYIKVFADSPFSSAAAAEEEELLYYASNIVNPLAENEVVRVKAPSIPLTSMRIEVFGDNLILNARCNWLGLFVPDASIS